MLQRCLAILVPLCLFGLVLGAKLDLVHRYGSDLPRWDQLDAEGLAVFVPLAETRLGFSDLLRPHNEHRIFWTKLLGLVELKLNGQWDARLQCAVNAVLHSLVAVLVFVFARRNLPPGLAPGVFVLVAVLFGLPLAWENPLAGFHSQQYLLLGFSFLAMWLLPFARPFAARWWLGSAALFAALGTMGSGFFAAAIVAGVVALRAWRGRAAEVLRQSWPTLAVCGVALGLGALGHVSVNYHDALKARSVSDFLLYALHCLQWPAERWSFLALLFWFPAGWLAWLVARRRPIDNEPFALTLCGLAAWTGLQILATAYARGAGAGMPSSRYLDTLAFGILVNGLTLAFLAPRLPRRYAASLGGLWLLALAGGLGTQLGVIFRHILPANRYHLEACEENVRRYLVTGSTADLPEDNIPYPGVRALRERIDLPALRAILPVSVRVPVPLVAAPEPTPFFLRDTIRRAGKFSPPPPALPEALDGLPDLAARRVWLTDPAQGTGDWRSQPFTLARDTMLRFLVAGRPGSALSLSLVNTAGPVVDVDLSRISPAIWRAVHVAAPRGTYVLTARVADPARWLAFAEPVEMAHGSFWVSQAVRRGWLLWTVSLAVGVLAAAGARYCARRGKPVS